MYMRFGGRRLGANFCGGICGFNSGYWRGRLRCGVGDSDLVVLGVDRRGAGRVWVVVLAKAAIELYLNKCYRRGLRRL